MRLPSPETAAAAPAVRAVFFARRNTWPLPGLHPVVGRFTLNRRGLVREVDTGLPLQQPRQIFSMASTFGSSGSRAGVKPLPGSDGSWAGGSGAEPVRRESGVSDGGTDGAAVDIIVEAEAWLCMPRAAAAFLAVAPSRGRRDQRILHCSVRRRPLAGLDGLIVASQHGGA
ncbi:MAG: hypothetical protein P4M07_14595 [Xanthobacteraceae bacterium]|nr:hypothetical protein [Xanthobacteraceae bacterium]